MEQKTKVVTLFLILFYTINRILFCVYFYFSISELFYLLTPSLLLIASVYFNNEHISFAFGIFCLIICSAFGVASYNAISVIMSIIAIIIALILTIMIANSLYKKTYKDSTDNAIKQTKKDIIQLKRQVQLLQANNATVSEPIQQAKGLDNDSDEKTIIKTKILETKERETAASKKKGKWLTALASGVSAGFGGSATQNMLAGHTQAAHNSRNAQFETVVTFLVIYSDNSRETVDTIKDDDKYNEYIMYLE